MSDFSLLAATRAIEKSMPYVLYRLLVCLGVALAYLFSALIGAGTLIAFGFLAKNPGVFAPFGAVLGFVGCGYLMYRLRSWFLYAVKAGQLALLNEQAQGRAIPEGKAQIDYAKQKVEEYFPRGSELLELDEAAKRTLADIPKGHPAPDGEPASPAATFKTRLLGRLYAQNDQAVLAWHFQSGADNPWRSAASALTALSAHYGELLKYRIYASLFEGFGFIASFAVLSVPFKNIAGVLPVSVGFWPYVFAGVFAWTLKAAFFEPIAQAAIMNSLFHLIGHHPDPAQEAALERRSEAFREIRERAA
jgi:hypothetical protein